MCLSDKDVFGFLDNGINWNTAGYYLSHNTLGPHCTSIQPSHPGTGTARLQVRLRLSSEDGRGKEQKKRVAKISQKPK